MATADLTTTTKDSTAENLIEDAPDTLIFVKSRPGREGASIARLPADAKPLERIPAALRRQQPAGLPEVSEPQAVRHYTRLSQRNFSIDTNFYPLGSCTMKYNPRACEVAAALPGFRNLHPLQDARDCQGTLATFYELQHYLADITGLPEVALAPVAGAQGEFAGVATIFSWHKARATRRNVVLVPDSAHGTNPASAVLAGFEVKTIKSNSDGRVDLEALKAALDDKTAALMLTNPNTCGVFEQDILEIARLVHEAGALLYYDGANLNAIVGYARPGDMGFDVVHLNLHKTFSTPHGGGGPGAGPIAVRADLAEYLPRPRVKQLDDKSYGWDDVGPNSIGRLHAFYGNAAVLLRAYTYIRLQGGPGLRAIAENSVLNANYLLAKLSEDYEAPFPRPCKHEFILTLRKEARPAPHGPGVKAFDISKRLLDFGIHPPTNYFPLLVPECLLIEPTESESKETLDRFIAVMRQIRHELESSPATLTEAPHTLSVKRMDEVQAAKQLNVCCAGALACPA